jgi:aryl-alcohol dehydrogenase-like predicted oxidoreductase
MFAPFLSSEVAPPTVPVRRCGSSTLKLPILGMGCWSYGGGDYWGPQDQADVDAVVRYAIEHGCNFFDTAEAYNDGASESSLGAALRDVPREQVIIATKVSPSNADPRTLVKHCEASLGRLRTDYIDLYMVHWPLTPHAIRHFTTEEIPTPSVQAAFEALQGLQQAGKIRHIGVSNFGTAKLVEALTTGAQIVVNELPYSLLTRAIECEALPFCRSNGIGVLGYMTLLQGVLSDKYATLADLPEIRRRTRHFHYRSTPLARHGTVGAEKETLEALIGIREVAHRWHLSTPELALQWAMAGQGITSCLCGARQLEELKQNLKAAREPLDQELVAELNRITAPLLHKLGPSFDYYENPANDRTQ